MGFGATLEWPSVRAIEAETFDAAMAAARDMLADEPKCERIEIWAGGQCQKVLHRTPPSGAA